MGEKGSSDVGRGGSCCTCIMARAKGVGASKGLVAVNISNHITPTE